MPALEETLIERIHGQSGIGVGSGEDALAGPHRTPTVCGVSTLPHPHPPIHPVNRFLDRKADRKTHNRDRKGQKQNRQGDQSKDKLGEMEREKDILKEREIEDT